METIDKLTPEQCAVEGSTVGACLVQLGEDNFDRLIGGFLIELLKSFSPDGNVSPGLLKLVFERVIASHRHTKIEEIGKALSEQIQGRGIKIYGALTPMAVIEIIQAYLELHGDVYERANSKFKEPYDSDRGQLDANEERLKHQLAKTRYLYDLEPDQPKEGKSEEPKKDGEG